MFESILANAVIIILSIIMLWYGATLFVEAAARLARKVGLSELIIGLTVVAAGTSAPEFAVTISAALAGNPDISVSNIVGSNIFNLGIILGGVVLFQAIKTNRKLVYRDGVFLVLTSYLLWVFMLDLSLVRWEAAVLFLLLVGYIGYLYSLREEADEDMPEGEFTWWDVPRLLIGLGFIIFGGNFLVSSAVTIAQAYDIPEWIIGVTIVAAGTSAPEMATSFVALYRGHEGISIGNLIGSDLFNKLGVLGLAGLMQGGNSLQIDPAGLSSLFTLCIMVTIVLIFMRTGWKLTKWEGAVLIILNLGRWVYDFMQLS